MNVVLLTHPDNRRARFFQQALAHWHQPPARLLAWEDHLAGHEALAPLLAPGTVLRLDSPGEHFGVETALLALGAAEAEAEGSPFLAAEALPDLPFDHGRILHPRQWYLGFRRALRDIAARVARSEGVRLPVVPADTEVLFDKRLCHARCLAGEVPVPDSPGPVRSFDELVARLDAS